MELKDGFRIEYGAMLTNTTKQGIALEIESSNKPIIKGDIVNYGIIEASATAVKIGTTTNGRVFPLTSDTAANDSFFWNYSLIEATDTAFDIQAPNNSKHSFFLFNEGFYTALIAGKFKTTNADFYINNSGFIGIPATDRAMDITSYTGETPSFLGIRFTGDISTLQINDAIVCASWNVKFKKDSFIVLMGDGGITTQNAMHTQISLVSASNTIELPPGGVNNLFYTRFPDSKKTGIEFHLIKASSVTLKKNKIIADLTIIKDASITADIARLLQTQFPSQNIEEVLKKTILIAYEISKTLTANKQIPGVLLNNKIGDFYRKVKTINKMIDYVARNNHKSADEFFDLFLHDSSNKNIMSHIITASNVMNSINDRFTVTTNGANVNADRGITAGELYENISLWGKASIHGNNEKPHKKQSYSKMHNIIFSFGADTELNNGLMLGIHYGYSIAIVDTLGGMGNVKLSSDQIISHIFGTYAAMGFAVIDTKLNCMFGLSKHRSKDTIAGNLKPYNSNLICLNTTVSYPLNIIKLVNLDIAAVLGFNRVNVDKHQNKYSGNNKQAKNLQPKQSKNIIGIGFSTAAYNNLPLGNKIDMDYRLTLGYKFNIAGEDEIEISLDTEAKHKVKVNNRNPGGHSINFDLGLNFIAYKYIKLGLNANYNLGLSPPSNGYGANLKVGCVF